MPDTPQNPITDLLNRAAAGDAAAREELVPSVQEVLMGTARRIFRAERAGHTLQPTAVVDDALIEVLGNREGWTDRREFYAVAAVAMRRILVDHARRRQAQKRGGDWERSPFDPDHLEGPLAQLDIVALDDALDRLEQNRPVARQIVELRFFCGLTNEETSKVIEMALRSVEAEWAFARAWLRRELEEGPAA